MSLIELEPGLAVDPEQVAAVWQVDGRGDDRQPFSATKVELSNGHVLTSRTPYAEIMALLVPPPRDLLDRAGRCAVCVAEHRPSCSHARGGLT